MGLLVKGLGGVLRNDQGQGGAMQLLTARNLPQPWA